MIIDDNSHSLQLNYSNSDSVVSKVVALNYKERRFFFANNVRPKYPRFQYKFMSIPCGVGKFTDAEEMRVKYLRDILIDCKFWLSSPLDFNDPFDMSAHVVFEGEPKLIRERFRSLINSQATDKGWVERKKLLDDFMARGVNVWLSSIKKIFYERQRKTGIFSFAGDPRSILMWSHYANNHTGICLQFEVVKDPVTMLGAIPVDYVDEHPIYNWLLDSSEMYKRVLLSKFSVWGYEKESRIIRSEQAHSYLRFAPSALVGVIFGSRADEKVIEIVTNLLEERKKLGMPSVKVYKASKHESKYKLVIGT